MEGVWRCQGCGKTKDLKGPHLLGKATVRSDCWPCAKKQTFHCEPASVGKVPAAAATPALTKSASAPSPSPAKAQSPATANPFLKTATPVATGEVTAQQDRATLEPSVSDGGVWRCQGCGKTKDLKGPHLLGKATVRSDCWPCAKKQTFHCEPASVGKVPAASSAGPSFLYTTATAAASSSTTTATTTAAAATTSSANPFLPAGPLSLVSAWAPAGPTGGSYPSAFTTMASPGTGTPARPAGGNPFLAARSLPPPPHAPPQHLSGATLPSAHFRMETLVGTSPPFTFKATPAVPASDVVFADPVHLLPATTTAKAAEAGVAGRPLTAGGGGEKEGVTAKRPTLPQPQPSTSPDRASMGAPESLWICSECRKAKDLHGDHLRGKTSVRSDCWPCGKKQLFLLVNRSEGNRRSPSSSVARMGAAGGVAPIIASAATRRGGDGGGEGESRPHHSCGRAGLAVTGAHSGGLVDDHHNTGVAPSSAADAARERGGERSSWCAPVIPPNETVTDFYLLPEDSEEDLLTEAVFSSDHAYARMGAVDPETVGRVAAGGAGGGAMVMTTPSQRVHAAFNAQLLHTYRLRLVDGVPLRAVWHGAVLYVIAEEPPASTVQLLSGGTHMTTAASASSSGGVDIQTRQQRILHEATRAYEAMGRYAALLMSVDSKLAASRFRRVRRLFCHSPFSFAAGCRYMTEFASAPPPSSPSSPRQAAAAAEGGGGGACRPLAARQPPFTVYGPKPDATRAPTVWSRVIDSCPHARPVVVSEDQRVRAAQQLYRRVSWLAMPADMTGAAIQLMQEEQEEAAVAGVGAHREVGSGWELEEDAPATSGVDVVLIPSTVRLEDLPRAAALALPVKQF